MTLVLVPQGDGGPLQWENCFAAAGAALVALETAGAKHPTGSQFRANVMELNSAGKPVRKDVTRGGRPSQIVETARRAYGVTLDLSVMDFDAAWELGQRADVAVEFSISYAPVRTTRFDGSPGFRGLHAVVLSGGKVYDPLADGRRAGIPTGPNTWPKDLLRRASDGYAAAVGLRARRATVIVGRAPAVKPARYSVAFEPGVIWSYPVDATAHKDTDRVTFSRKTSAPCTAPFLIPWHGGKKRVVQVTSGVLMGKRVEPGAAHVQLVEHR